MPDKTLKHFEILKKKADVDLAAVEHLKNKPDIDRELLLFHLQQAAKKYLKTLLSYHNVHFEKTHDIIELIDLCVKNKIAMPEYTSDLENLYPFAVQGRYDTIPSGDIDPDLFINKLREFKDYVQKTITPPEY
jgi:HEPN domain-containing protein